VEDVAVQRADPTPRLQQSLDAVRAKVGAPKQVFSEANSPVTKDLNAHGFDAGITPFLQSVAATGKPEHRALAKLLLRFPEMLAAVDVVKTHAPDAAFAGVFVPKTGQVLVNTAVQGPRGAVDTVLHELLHAATAHSIDHPTPAQAAVIKRIESIRRNVLKKAQKSGDRSLIYGLSDTHEFFSTFLTSPQFQADISRMTPKSERNWVQVIVQAIRDLLNGRARTQAEQVSQQIFSDLIAFTQDSAARIYGRHAKTTDGKVLLDPRLLPAHHGTPHKVVGGMSTDKIGTGEGVQAYGWGLYFASNKGVAYGYASGLGKPIKSYDGADAMSPDEIDAKGIANMSDSEIISAIQAWGGDLGRKTPEQQAKAGREWAEGYGADSATRSQVMKAVRTFDPAKVTDRTGNLYTVELLVEDDELLDWDKPLTEQSEKVRTAILSSGIELYELSSGYGIYADFRAHKGSDRGGSEFLASLGIKGIRYADGNSRFVPYTNPGVHIHPIEKTRFEATAGLSGPVLGTFDSHEEAMKWLATQPGTKGPAFAIEVDVGEAEYIIRLEVGADEHRLGGVQPVPGDRLLDGQAHLSTFKIDTNLHK